MLLTFRRCLCINKFCFDAAGCTAFLPELENSDDEEDDDDDDDDDDDGVD